MSPRPSGAATQNQPARASPVAQAAKGIPPAPIQPARRPCVGAAPARSGQRARSKPRSHRSPLRQPRRARRTGHPGRGQGQDPGRATNPRPARRLAAAVGTDAETAAFADPVRLSASSSRPVALTKGAIIRVSEPPLAAGSVCAPSTVDPVTPATLVADWPVVAARGDAAGPAEAGETAGAVAIVEPLVAVLGIPGDAHRPLDRGRRRARGARRGGGASGDRPRGGRPGDGGSRGPADGADDGGSGRAGAGRAADGASDGGAGRAADGASDGGAGRAADGASDGRRRRWFRSTRRRCLR